MPDHAVILSDPTVINSAVLVSNTVVLILSTITAIILHITLDNFYMIGTIVLGFCFLSTQLSELAVPHALASTLTLATTISLIQVHASHISLGLIILCMSLVYGKKLDTNISTNVIMYFGLAY